MLEPSFVIVIVKGLVPRIDSVKRQRLHVWEFRPRSVILQGERFPKKHAAT